MSAPRCEKALPGLGRPCRTPMLFTTSPIGQSIFTCPTCERRAKGRCWACGRPRERTSNHAIYCEACRVQAKRKAGRACEADPVRRAKRRDGERRRMRRNAEAHARKQAQRVVWRKANPAKIKQYKRKAALNPTPRRKEREQWHNQQPERIAKKRAHALAKYYERHPVRPSPTCRQCGVAIPYVPPGRPKTRCEVCAPVRARQTVSPGTRP